MPDMIKTYENTVALFAETQNLPEEVVKVNGLIKHYFPDELICNREFENCIENPSDYTFTAIFKQYFALFPSYPELVRKNSHILLELIIKYLKPEEDLEVYPENESVTIGTSLKAFICAIEHKKNDIGCGYAEKMIGYLSKLEETWEKEPSYIHLCDILEYLLAQWDYFCGDKCAMATIHYVMLEYNLKYSKEAFLDTYSAFVRLSKLNYILETKPSSIFLGSDEY